MTLKRVQTGKTKTQGWEFGLRRTFPISAEKAWEVLFTQPGLGYWLGEGVEPEKFQPGEAYTTKDGTTGDIRSYANGSMIRMTWRPVDWDFSSTLQVRVVPVKTGTTISFHHEKLETGDQREAMRLHWSAVMDKLEKLIDAK